MTTPPHGPRPPTLSVELPGGVDRLRQLVLHIAERLSDAQHFGVIKLNKVLWWADFRSFAERGVPVTGREYKRLEHGPAPREMPWLQREMLDAELIRVERDETVETWTELRTVALAAADLSMFSPEDLGFVDRAITRYRDLTAMQTSDDSHGAAWKSRNNGDPMPYELALLSDVPLGRKQFLRLRSLVDAAGLTTL